MPTTIEIWKPVIGYEGSYEVSSKGRVRSVDRIIHRKNGVKAFCKGRILKPAPVKGRYLTVVLGRGNTKTVHSLVAAAFLGRCPERQEVRHGIGGLKDNGVENLCYGTHRQNLFDRYRDGTVSNAKKIQRSDGKIFRSAAEAARMTGVAISGISQAANKLRKTAAGFKWEYIDG